MSLHDIQRKVRAAKTNRNNFGGYNYRNAEGILAELKAALPYGWTCIGTDSIHEVGPALFLCHTIQLRDEAGAVIAEAKGWAGHQLEKKGMDFAQITGSCSTYAKKYALQNLLIIDDGSVDPDAQENKPPTDPVSDAILDGLREDASPEEIANAYADYIAEKVTTYKDVKWLDQFMQKSREKMDFIGMYAPERHGEVRSAALAHRDAIKGKAA